MARRPLRMTIEEYFAKAPVALKPTELIFGVLQVADSPSPRHQTAVLQLLLSLDAHVHDRGLGRMYMAPMDVVLDERRALVVQPDLCFVSTERAAIVTDRIAGAPDLIVDVLSPQLRIGRPDERVQWFAECGVRECWLVHQNLRSIAVIRFADRRMVSRIVYQRREAISSSVLSDFSSCLDDILPDI